MVKWWLKGDLEEVVILLVAQLKINKQNVCGTVYFEVLLPCSIIGFTLHYVFLPRINIALNELMEAYNNHRLSTEHNWIPNQIWYNSMSNPVNPITNDLVDEETNYIQYYVEDSEGLYPIDPDVNNVVVSAVDVPLAEKINNLMRNSTDPVRESPDMGIDIYLAVLGLIHETLGGQL